ncbi:hypothetical protein ACEQUB_03252 [Ralstonia syzygii]|uniref:Putative lipoprotein transmembrane n=2 Tax=Ralstonia syzygii TaxID=28097 RepID=G3A268_9RALS|nr:hypothetical protein LMG10661_02873 [Ralstonia syzygii subsp. syzygii]CCA85500.1 putative lipoprotein transmembrane [Ralstonia syzygii R24]
MTIRTIAAGVGGALWLAGCATTYSEPPPQARTASVELIRLPGSAPAMLVFDDAKTCTGARVAIPSNTPVRPVRVLADVPTTVAANHARVNGNGVYRCAVAVSFVPEAGHRYRLRSQYPEGEHTCRAALTESTDGTTWRPVVARYRQWSGQATCPVLTDADIGRLRDRTHSPDGATTLNDLKDLM